MSTRTCLDCGRDETLPCTAGNGVRVYDSHRLPPVERPPITPVERPPITPVEVLAAFEAVQPGDGGEVRDDIIVLETIRDHFVYAYKGAEGWWEARLEVTFPSSLAVGFVVPLKQGPVWYEDSETTVEDVVDWLRVITNSQADAE